MPDHQTAAPLVDIENRICPGCKKSAVSESGGLVVAFGSVLLNLLPDPPPLLLQ
ncbi:hypothetical protein JVT61DRAFT_3106 [Boletus reticuloceps]|uniref:Uncharacterized protein n=1 Tax=Boletus reticuloceps TaxID=495285 RepID=A0A8I3AAL3_9AGAM|nr:hypothetical protein JVT61DRAFT_3106 [Boletus reticuloceps]